jgi:hypothetical protein
VLLGRDHPTEEEVCAPVMMRRFVADFEAEFGSVLCHELVGISPDIPRAEFSVQYKAGDTRARVCNRLEAFTVRRFYALIEQYELEED